MNTPSARRACGVGRPLTGASKPSSRVPLIRWSQLTSSVANSVNRDTPSGRLRESHLVAEAVECARPRLVELQRQAGARRADGDGTGGRRGEPIGPAAAGGPASGPERPRAWPRRPAGPPWSDSRRGALAASTPSPRSRRLVLGTDLPVQQLGRPGIGDHVVLVEIPPGAAVTEPHEHTVDQLAAGRQRAGAALAAPLAERPAGIGSQGRARSPRWTARAPPASAASCRARRPRSASGARRWRRRPAARPRRTGRRAAPSGRRRRTPCCRAGSPG